MPGNGSVQLTGKLGDVLKESVEVALSWVKGHAFELGLTQDPTENIMKNRGIHVHCPAGAIPVSKKMSPHHKVIKFSNLLQERWAFGRDGAHNRPHLFIFWQSSTTDYGYDWRDFSTR